MNGEDQPASDIQIPQGQTPAPAPEVQNANPAQAATAAQLEQTEERIEERMSAFERSMVRLTRAGVIIAVVTGVIFLGQLYVMISGGTQTDKLIRYASTQAQAASDIAEASDDFTDSAKWMEEHMDDAANAVQDNADIARKTLEDTERSIKNTQIAFRDDQRAWVAGANLSMEGTEVDAIPKGKITWFNSGKTFAKHLNGLAHLRFFANMVSTEKELLESASTGITAQEASIGVLPPQGSAQSVLTLGHKLSVADKSEIDSFYTYLWGQISYDDVFGRRHETIVCAYRKGTVGEFLQCPFHNDAD